MTSAWGKRGQLLLTCAGAAACTGVLGLDHPAPSTTQDGGAGGAASAGVSGTPPPVGGTVTRGGRSSLDAGGAESAGSGGASGAGEEPGCVTVDECTVDSPACEGACVGPSAPGKCVVLARDGDGDRHGAAGCELAPGDDCDDARPDVAPGAPELCDGRDNDCDELVDLDDGLTLSGTESAFAEDLAPLTGRRPQVAWSAAHEVYAVLWASGDEGAESIRFQTWDAAGVALMEPVVVNPGLPGASRHALAAGGSAFGVIWTSSAPDAQIRAREIGVDGSLGEIVVLSTADEDPAGADVALAWLERGEWMATWIPLSFDQGLAVFARKWTAAGPSTPASALGFSDGTQQQMVVSGNTTLVSFTAVHEATTVLVDQSLINIDPVTPLVSRGATLGASERGFVAAWQTGSAPDSPLSFVELNRDGSVRCGPVRLPGAGFYPAAVVSSPEQSVIFADRAIELVEVLSGCHPGRRIVSRLTPDRARNVGAASAGERGLALVWYGFHDPSPFVDLRRRTFGANFCD